MLILALDPSGNFDDGKGTTGWSVLDENLNIISFGSIKAQDYKNTHEYTDEHIRLIEEVNPNIIVIEDYKLYADKAMSQINSRFETPKLIGVLEHYCYQKNISIHRQAASEVKKRWCDELLVYNNFVEKSGNKYLINGTIVSEHTRDSLRHGIHFIKFKLKRLYGTKDNR